MTTLSAKLDVAPLVGRMSRLALSLEHRQHLHEILVIEAQKEIIRNWPTAPALAPVTLAARRAGGQAILQDKGMLRLSVVGRSPASSISTEQGTLNKAEQAVSVIGTSIPWAWVHNKRGETTITPSKAKALAIPATYEAKKAGSPRAFKGKLKFVPAKTQNCVGMLVTYQRRRRKGERPAYKIQYYLMRRVVIRGRPFIPTIAEFAPHAIAVTRKWLSMQVQAGNG